MRQAEDLEVLLRGHGGVEQALRLVPALGKDQPHDGDSKPRGLAGLLQRSRAGLFVKKLMDDRAPNLASLLAWSSLSAILPLILGVLSIAGILLRDPQVLDQVYNTLLALLPGQAAGPVASALEGVRQASAAPAGLVALVLLLYNGSSFFCPGHT